MSTWKMKKLCPDCGEPMSDKPWPECNHEPHVLSYFGKTFTESQRDINDWPEIAKFVNDNLWDMIKEQPK